MNIIHKGYIKKYLISNYNSGHFDKSFKIISKHIAYKIIQHQNLQQINLYNLSINDGSLKYLPKLYNLKSVNIDCNFVTDNGLQCIVALYILPNYKMLKDMI